MNPTNGNGLAATNNQPAETPTESTTDFIANSTTEASDLVAQYLEQRWVLTAIPPNSKGPKTPGWNKREKALKGATLPDGYGVGLCHAYSGTAALDIDSWNEAAIALAAHAIDLQALYDAPDAVTINSGRVGRGKLLFKMPFGLTLPSKAIKNASGQVMYEMRCSTADGLTVQDVLPSAGLHPLTLQPYQWGGRGEWTDLPTIPIAVLTHWTDLLADNRALQTSQPATSSTARPEITLEIAREMLEFISPDCNREDWRNTGMALKHQFGNAGFELWDDRSKIGSKYKAGEMQGQWDSFKTDHPNGVTIGTLMHLARQGGWAGITPDLSNLFPAISTPAGTHPLAVFVPVSYQPRHPEFLIPGAVGMGLVVISGEAGIGKTSTLLPLACMVAGVHEDGHPLAPRHWRHVVYIVEDVEQAQRILAGMATVPGFNGDAARERLHIVDAVRMAPTEVAKVGKTYADRFTRIVDGVVLLPLVVIDTKSAVLDIEEENSNSETSQAIAALRQGFEKLPIWLIGHTAKASQGVTDAASLSSRGAGSSGADANQTLFLVSENGTRYLKRGKTRFEASWDALEITTHTTNLIAPDQWGELAPLTLRWNSIKPPTASTTICKAVRDQQAADADREKLHAQIIEVVADSFEKQTPLNKTAIKAAIGGNGATVGNAIEFLASGGHLVEIHIPKDERANPRRGSYMVALTELERTEYLESGTLPDLKTKFAPSWTCIR